MLWYLRLTGVVAFELSGARVLLLIFPNTFEYFFIAYELVRVRWEPSRGWSEQRRVVRIAATIWIVVKLPQEWWIHVAGLDVTDVLGERPWLLAALGGVATTAVVVATRLVRLPAPDWATSFSVDAHATTVVGEPADPPRATWALIRYPIVEKVVLVSLVTVTFAQILPTSAAVGFARVTIGVTVVVLVNAFIGRWLAGRGTAWIHTGAALLGMGSVNVGMVVVVALASHGSTLAFDGRVALFLVLLLTLIVTLYDRYRALRLLSIGATGPRSRSSVGDGRLRP